MASKIHPAVREYIKGQRLREQYSVTAIASRHGFQRAWLWKLVKKHLKENGLPSTNDENPSKTHLREGLDSATKSSLPSLPDQPEDRVQRT